MLLLVTPAAAAAADADALPHGPFQGHHLSQKKTESMLCTLFSNPHPVPSLPVPVPPLPVPVPPLPVPAEDPDPLEVNPRTGSHPLAHARACALTPVLGPRGGVKNPGPVLGQNRS